MASLNSVSLIGNLGKDPVIRQTQGGQPVANFSLATRESFVKDGQKSETTEWHNVVAWGKTAELAAKFLRKGSLVFLEGKLTTRKWNKDGIDHHTTEIVARSIQFLDRKSDDRTAKAEAACADFDDLASIPFV